MTLYDPQELDPLPELLEKKTLTDDEVLECKKAIFRVVGMESKNDALPVPATGGSRGKGSKRDEQYRQLWAEIEALVGAYVDTSENHGKVLECVHECKKPGGDEVTASVSVSPAVRSRKGSSGGVTPKKEDRVKVTSVSEEEAGWQELDRYTSMTEREKKDALQTEKPIQSSPPKKMKTEDLIMRPGGQSVLSMWSHRLISSQASRHREFDGMMEAGGGKAQLYIHMDEQSQEQNM